MKTLFGSANMKIFWVTFGFAFAAFLVIIGSVTIYVSWVLLIIWALVSSSLNPKERLGLFLLVLPFFLVLPGLGSDTLSSWRIALLVLAMLSIRDLLKSGNKKSISEAFGKYGFRSPELWIGLIILLGILSALWARFPLVTLKFVSFVLNAGLVYLVASVAVRDRTGLFGILKYLSISTGFIILIGFFQFVATFFIDQYWFWQYWAIRVIAPFYGQGLAGVLSYSNSWFSFTGEGQHLRMFSVLPDSHSFAVICIFFIAASVPWLGWVSVRFSSKSDRFRKRSKLILWYAIRLAGLGVVLSGTRGVWVGMLVPLVIVGVLYSLKEYRKLMSKWMISLLLILLLFLVSPLFDYAVAKLHYSSDSYLARVASIYDLTESSNTGRMAIWLSSYQFALRHPLGVGLGNFIVANNTVAEGGFQVIANTVNSRFNLPQRFVTAHNTYLHLWVELGILGLVLIVALLWTLLVQGLKLLREHRKRDQSTVLVELSILILFAWLAGYAFFDVALFNDRVLIYTFVFLALLNKSKQYA